MRQCEVMVNKVGAGILTETDSGEYEFVYHPDYADNLANEPVSLTMPLRREPYLSTSLFAPFFNILTEGANRQLQSRVLHIDINDDFGIMLKTCRQDTIGAITVKPI